MSKTSTCIGSIRTELEFSWTQSNVKTLTITWPAYRMKAELAVNMDTENRGVRLWYNNEEIPLRTDSYDLEEELFAIPAPQEVYEWIEETDLDTLTWWGIDDFALWMVQRVLAVMIVQYKNYKELHLPIIGYFLKKGSNNAQYFHFPDNVAVVFNNKETKTVVIYFLSLNMRLAFYIGSEADKGEFPEKRREVHLENGDKKLLEIDCPKYEALLDQFEKEYIGPRDYIQTGEFEDWLDEMFILLSQTSSTTKKEAEDAADPAVDEVGIYRQLKAMFYAQNTPDFLERVIRGLPDENRVRILKDLEKVIETAKEEIVPGDIVMFEHEGKHLVVSNDGETVHTITKKAGRMITDSFPLEKAFPTGCHYDTWDDVDQELNLFF